MTSRPAEPSPILFFDTINAYQRTAALKAAIELDVFTAIAKGAVTAQAIAEECGASERGTRILCDYLVIIGFLNKQAQSYGLTPDSAMFLNKDSPAYVGGAIEFLLSPMLLEGFKDIAAAVRKGGSIVSEEGTVAPEHPIWVKFARAMAPLAGFTAQALAELVARQVGQPRKVLDIAAGHGLFGITLARLNPEVKIVGQDWSNVLEVAKENARKAGVEERYTTIEGSAFDVDFGSGYDLILLTNFLHHFDKETCEKLLVKVREALSDGGSAVTLEFIPNEDRVSPPVAAAFSMTMLGSTPSGDAYTFPELESMFSNAGYTRSELHSLPVTFQQVVISQK
ncbi:MAG TPA: class I SAM-dependent methyltransferase [Pyrinomonadaceae bacterium]|jgi:ubiquinone/menaquinone biosynthesis C-methylase UbiE|nr:class I SAM-dependent methyltransferase [Pyrinomonadaceae bacterium]